MASGLERVRASRVTMAVRYCATDATASGLRALEPPPGVTVEPDQHRLTRSWDRRAGDPFPSLDSLWSRFAQDLDLFDEACRGRGVQEPTVERCELSYVNAVTAEEEWVRRRHLERVLIRALRQELGGDFLPPAAGVTAETTFAVHASDGLHAGQLCITVSSVTSEVPNPLLGLSLTASGPVAVTGRDGVAQFFDAAFEWIVRGFASVASDAAGRP